MSRPVTALTAPPDEADLRIRLEGGYERLLQARARYDEANAALGVVLFGCVVNGLFAGLLFNLSLERLEALLVSLFTYLEPLNAALLGVVVLNEPFGLQSAAGLVLVLIAGAWAATEPRPAPATLAA